MQRGRQVRNIQTLPILAIEVDCKREKSDPRRCARHNGRVRENPGRQQPCWGSLFCTNLTQPTGNLDSVTAREIINILKTLAKDRDKCVIVVTHSKEVADSADIILELSGKKLKKVNKMNLEVE